MTFHRARSMSDISSEKARSRTLRLKPCVVSSMFTVPTSARFPGSPTRIQCACSARAPSPGGRWVRSGPLRSPPSGASRRSSMRLSTSARYCSTRARFISSTTQTWCTPGRFAASAASARSGPGRKRPARSVYPRTSELSVQSGRTGSVSETPPVSSATSFGSCDLPVPETPARMTKGLVRRAVTYAAICQGSNTKPFASIAAVSSASAARRSNARGGGLGVSPIVKPS